MAHLAAVFFPPCEDPTLAVSTAHESLNLLAVEALGPRAISEAVTLFEVDAMLVKQMQALLLVVYQEQDEPGRCEGGRREHRQEVSCAQCRSVL